MVMICNYLEWMRHLTIPELNISDKSFQYWYYTRSIISPHRRASNNVLLGKYSPELFRLPSTNLIFFENVFKRQWLPNKNQTIRYRKKLKLK